MNEFPSMRNDEKLAGEGGVSKKTFLHMVSLKPEMLAGI